MDVSVSLILSIVLVLMLMRKIDIGIALFIGATVLSILAFGFQGFYVLFESLVSAETIRIVTIVVLAFTLGYTMEYFGMLKQLADSLADTLGGYSFIFIPLLVGLLPMPGGALISAVMLSPFIKKFALSSEKATALNYWYRHIWVTVWPLFPTVIIGAAVLRINFSDFVHSTAPLAVISFLSGLTFAARVGGGGRFDIMEIIKSLKFFYPVLLVAMLTLILKIDLMLTLASAVLLLFLQNKGGLDDAKKIFSRTIDHRIIILVFAVMCYKGVIESSGAAESLFFNLERYRIPEPVAAFILTFIVGFATGIELSYSSIALPLLIGFTGSGSLIHPENIMLVMCAGFAGVILSPMHLCHILTAEYFGAEIQKSYKLIIPSALILVSSTIVLYLLLLPL
jgi:hypothetical protein